VLSALATYLFQYREVIIPHIGKFSLRYLPSRLDFADRLIYPPSYEVFFNEQNDALTNLPHFDGKENVGDADLEHLGREIKKMLQQGTVEWYGLGQLQFIDDKIVFHTAYQPTLKPIAANKIIRGNTYHSVLVGEREMQSDDTSYINGQPKTKKSLAVTIGWIIVLLSLAFIFYHLYHNRFKVRSTGSQKKVVVSISPSTARFEHSIFI
jgi:hypothetical protein